MFSLDFELVWEYREELLRALLVTLQLFVVPLVLSLIPALLVALGRSYGAGFLRKMLTAVVYAVRSLPALLVVMIVYFGLPFAGITFSGLFSVVFTLTIVQTVYFSEIFRAALESIDKGQVEAGLALGMRPLEILKEVMIPQALKVAGPPSVSACIQLMHNTTIASAVALLDLIGRASNIAVITLESSPILIVSLVYLIILLPLVRATRVLEKRRQALLSPQP